MANAVEIPYHYLVFYIADDQLKFGKDIVDID